MVFRYPAGQWLPASTGRSQFLVRERKRGTRASASVVNTAYYPTKWLHYGAGPPILQATRRLDIVQDRIEKRVTLKAPVERVWRALTDYREFGEWFRVKLENPFVVGQVTRGSLTFPGYEHLKWEATVKELQPERLFSFTWHPYAVDPEADYSEETPTLVEFRLEPVTDGTILVISESGFSALPEDRGPEAFRQNAGGWEAQAKSIAAHVEI